MKPPLAGYGRYDDGTVHCPRARSEMTPCIARDGSICLADDQRCVGCFGDPRELLRQLRIAAKTPISPPRNPDRCADELAALVLTATQSRGLV